MARRQVKTAALRPTARKAGAGVDEKTVIDSVGANCAAFRHERQLSLDALAKLSGISKGMLVEIEQRRTNPSIATLCRIANALGVGLAELLYEEPAPARVVRHPADAGKEFWTTRAGSAAALIDATRLSNVGGELWRWTLAPGEGFEAPRHPQGTQEFLYVLQGTLSVEVAGERTRCPARSSLRVRTDAPHAYRNEEAVPCGFIMFVLEAIVR
ncbi:MAG: cupin domain-containing protein [Steroidobacteraceae bacterium]